MMELMSKSKNRNNKNKISAQEIAQLQQILQINNKRFQMIEELL